MGKLLLCIGFAVGLGAVMLQLRQEALSLNYQTSRLHGEIESRQAELWSQQLRIAEATAPNAIAEKVRQDKIPLTPVAPARQQTRNWVEPQTPPAPAAVAQAQ